MTDIPSDPDCPAPPGSVSASELSRRGFLKTVGVGAAAVAASGAPGTAANAQAVTAEIDKVKRSLTGTDSGAD